MRLGDDIDDYCSRCKLSATHAVVSMAGEEARKVRCRTCNHEHNYRRNKGGRGSMSKKEAFDKVLASITGAVEEGKKTGRK
ncbi:MAG TPA: hypothetical protein VMT05_03205 [Terriglobales bacterium]|jgi:ribosomal protein L44E|nr:hypothetical protein [Terriglobales bacterium]